jgi:hypothetical protein
MLRIALRMRSAEGRPIDWELQGQVDRSALLFKDEDFSRTDAESAA